MELSRCIRSLSVKRRKGDAFGESPDVVAEEVPVALVYNGISHAVMMALPADLEAFAVGFSLTEGIVTGVSDIYGIEVTPACGRGLQVELEISSEAFMRLKDRRRTLAGRTGCGVCGLEQISDVLRPIPELPRTASFDLGRLDAALDGMKAAQTAGDATGCTHAAALLDDEGGIVACLEDVGRHVALDKLLGARALNAGKPGWESRTVLISSRASYEMVQKAASCGIEILFAVSAATGLAVDAARKAGLTLGSFCRPGRCTVVSCPERLTNFGLGATDTPAPELEAERSFRHAPEARCPSRGDRRDI